MPVLGSLARVVVEIRLGLAAATSLAEAVGEPAPDGLAARSLCTMTGCGDQVSDGPAGSFPPAATTLLPWRRAAEFTNTLGLDERVELEPVRMILSNPGLSFACQFLALSNLPLRSYAPR